MKTCVLVLFLLAVTTASSLAQQTFKFGYVDLGKCFTNYFKTKLADGNLKEEGAVLDKERKEMVDKLQKMNENYKKLLDGANDQAASVEEREKRKKGAEEELVKMRGAQTEIEQFERQAGSMLGEKRRRLRENILAEIKEVVKTQAKARGYTLVVDVAAEINNTPVVLFNSGNDDLTEGVVNDLNAKAPAGVKAGDTAPAK
jgi:outer membrane protein